MPKSWQQFSLIKFNPGQGTHVWRLSVDRDEKEIQQFIGELSAEEQKRANRMLSVKSKKQYVLSRIALKNVLYHSLEKPQNEIILQFNEFGKPFLPGNMPSFNISHSNKCALIAVSWDGDIGVDIEYKQERHASQKIARRFFSDDEVKDLQALPANLQVQGFFNCWTRKEAYIKGKGKGLAIPLGSFAVSLDPAESVYLKFDINDKQAVQEWNFETLDADPEYADAIAIKSSQYHLHLWDYEL